MSGTLNETVASSERSELDATHAETGSYTDFINLVTTVEAVKAYEAFIDNDGNNDAFSNDPHSDRGGVSTDVSPSSAGTPMLIAIESAFDTFMENGEQEVIWSDFVNYTDSHPIILEGDGTQDGEHSGG